jgi:hypothetical protein
MRSSLYNVCGARPKIRFVYNIILSDDERHDARRPIVCRIGHEGESARFIAGAIFPLPLCSQDSEVVSVERAQDFFSVRGSTTNLRWLSIDERAGIVSDSVSKRGSQPATLVGGAIRFDPYLTAEWLRSQSAFSAT